jgi:hypothetical protein
MSAKSTAQRVKQQRQARLDEGWEEVRVWAPNAEAAVAIRQYAGILRRESENLPGLDEVCKSMKPEIYQRIKNAILEQGAPAYTTPSGAVLLLLTELAEEGNLQAISEAFNEFSKAKPGNMLYVEEKIPAKILNQYWLRKLQLNLESLTSWMNNNPGWANELKSKLRVPEEFERVVNAAAEEIRQATGSKGSKS